LFDAKPYDKVWFEKLKDNYDIEVVYIDEKLHHLRWLWLKALMG
jgi:hypothetical protein